MIPLEFVLFSIILLFSLIGSYLYLSLYLNKLLDYSNNLVLNEKIYQISVSFLKYKLFNYSNFTVFFYDNGNIFCKNNTYHIYLSRGKTLYNLNTYIICNNSNNYNFYEGVSYW